MAEDRPIKWIVEIKAPAKQANYDSYYARINPLLEFTSWLSIPSKRNLRLDISGYDCSFQFCQYLLERNPKLQILFHLTCFDLNRSNIEQRLARLRRELGVTHILIITGDDYAPLDEGLNFSDSNELVEVVLGRFGCEFESIAVGAYPGGNRKDSFDDRGECLRLARKIAAGIDTVFTQCFFRVQEFETFQQEMSRHHPRAKIVPSIALFGDLEGLRKVQQFTRSAGTSEIVEELNGIEIRDLLLELCRKLKQSIVMDPQKASQVIIDLCTFNQFEVAKHIMKTLGTAKNRHDS